MALPSYAGANILGSLNGLFKEVYADKLENLIPDGVHMLKEIPFVGKDKMPGNLYHQPVVLGLEHGITFAGPSDDAFTLIAPVSGQIKDAQVSGNPVVLRSVIGYTSASRASSAGPRAFMDATKFLVANMVRSISRKLEVEMFYGQTQYGIIAAVGGATVTTVAGNVVTLAANQVQITAAEWAPGIWVGGEGMPLEIRDTSTAVSRGTPTITSVDMTNQLLTLNTLPAGTVATDNIYHLGAFGNEFAGLVKIITNTGSLFNINAGQYALWAGNVFSSGGGALSFAKLEAAVARAVEKGLDSDVKVMVNPRTWANLLSDQAALRRYDGSDAKTEMENGSRSLKFHGQNGMMEIIPSIFVKQGLAVIIPIEEYIRVGSTDITFRRPGQGDEFFRELDGSAGYELRCFSDQALFTYAPGKSVLVNNIVNN